MASGYAALTASEAVTYNEYTRLRQLSDWDEFTAEQSDRKDAAGAWINARRDYLVDLANGDVDNGNGAGWETADRKARYDYLGTKSSGSPHELCSLPTEGGMDFEGVLISEREMWWRNPKGEYAEQSARRQACTDALIARRKYVWNLAEGNVDGAEPGWDRSDRRQRYYNLQVATKYGSGYDDWLKSYDATTGKPKGGDGSSARDKALAWTKKRRGCYESPDGSNCDSRSDGIRTAQDKCANGTWLRNQPWCGTWCWNALNAAGVQGLDPNIASVEWIEARARSGQAPFGRGWTTDPSKVLRGDLVCLFSPGQHVGLVVTPGPSPQVDEGNTSDTSALRTRSKSEVVGYALVDYPG